jgi:putative SOS response-associated peptidase YedK
MCGRYTLFDEELEQLAVLPDGTKLLPRWNVAPMQWMPVVTADSPLAIMRWGLVPSWAKDDSAAAKCINARAETITEKPTFRSAIRRRRCLVPMSGYYEWSGTTGKKTPYFIHGQTLLRAAGIWEEWEREGNFLQTFALITREASGTAAAVHHRMPVFIAPEDRAIWLGGQPEEALVLIQPTQEPPVLTLREVSAKVGNARHDDPALIRGIEPLAPDTLFG